MRLVIALLFTMLPLFAATLDVTDYGAVGDCTEITVSVVEDSAVITASESFGAGDVGKVVQLFGAGYYATLLGVGEGGYFNGNYSGTTPTPMDLVAEIVSVDGVEATLDRWCGVTASGIRCIIGTQNKTAFDAAIAAAGLNDTITIPAGNYHLVAPSALDTNYVQTIYYDSQPTITISARGGIIFKGDGTNSTILTGTGAWQQKAYDDAYRGYLFRLDGDVAPANDGPLIFDGIQFNGAATRNHSTTYTFWPAVPTDGSGWDGTHHAFVHTTTPRGQAYTSWTNCLFTRWHGETIAGISTGVGSRDVGNCWFVDGNSTVINFNYPHDFHDNLVDDYWQVAEDGQFRAATGVSYIRNNVFRNIYGSTAIALVGAYIDVDAPSYVISSNDFTIAAGKYAIGTAGCKGLTVISNTFNNGAIAFGMAGNQATYWNSDFVVSSNVFIGQQVAIMFLGRDGVYQNRTVNVTVEHNLASGLTSWFAMAGNGNLSQTTNAVFRSNVANKGLSSYYADTSAGWWYKDELSNDFPWRSNTDATGVTNALSYAYGSRHTLSSQVAGSVWTLDDTQPSRMPSGAEMSVTNGLAGAVSLYLSRTNYPAGISVTLTPGEPATRLYWVANGWRTSKGTSHATTTRTPSLRGRYP